MEAADLPLPKTNKRKDGHFIDCRWEEDDVTVELDSYAYHSTRQSWELDRERERAARKRGDRLERFTWEDVTERADETVEVLRRLVTPARGRRRLS